MRMRAAWVFVLGCTVLAQPSYEELFREGARLAELRDYAGASRAYESAARLRPSAPEARANLAVVYNTAGRYSDAVDAALEALRIQPQLVPPRIILGLALVRLHRAGEAAPELEQVLITDPGPSAPRPSMTKRAHWRAMPAMHSHGWDKRTRIPGRANCSLAMLPGSSAISRSPSVIIRPPLVSSPTIRRRSWDWARSTGS